MTRPADDAILAHAARHAQAHPQYFGWILSRYREAEQLSESQLADSLGITSHDLLRLCLCLRPRVTSFAGDIQQISAHFKADPTVLAQAVRLVESASVMAAVEGGQTTTAESGLLMAARKRRKRTRRAGKKKHDHEPSAS